MGTRWLAVVAALLSSALIVAVPQQKSTEGFPYSAWLTHKEVTQIPWVFAVGKPRIRADLRREVVMTVTLDSEAYANGRNPDVVLYARVLQEGRAIGPLLTAVAREREQRFAADLRSKGMPDRMIALASQMTAPAAAMPGRYKLEIALLDRETGRYNVHFEDLTIPGKANDPFERVVAGPLAFEFLQAPPPPKDPPINFVFQSELRTARDLGISPLGPRLRAPVFKTADGGVSSTPAPRLLIERPEVLKLSVISVVSPPVNRAEQGTTIGPFQNNLLAMLGALTRFEVARGSADFTAVDLIDRSRPFDRKDLKDVSFRALQELLAKDRLEINLNELVGESRAGQTFRDLLSQRLHEAEEDTSGAKHAIILVGPRTDFPDSAKLKEIPVAANCHCKIFYVRFFLVANEKDDMPRLLSAYKPRLFEPLDFAQFRSNVATIYEELRDK